MNPHPSTLRLPACRALRRWRLRDVIRMLAGLGVVVLGLRLSRAVPVPAGAEGHFDVLEYRVEGAQKLPRVEVESAVYPFLGPYRTTQDVEKAKEALEKAYRDKGYQAVSVVIPSQKVNRGVIVLHVYEGEVGRVRVYGARYFSPSEIKKSAPSLAEGRVLDFKSVSQDLVSLNQSADRRVTPTLKPGSLPGLVDVDLEVKDTFPLHGSVEFNNRYSPGTNPYRLNTTVSYGNLWQWGHLVGFSYQTDPEDFSAVEVFSGFYQLPVPDVDGLTLMVQGTKQNSNVSTAAEGGSNSVGAGDTIGLRAALALPGEKEFFQSVTFGVDYKYSRNTTTFGANIEDPYPKEPITYFPFSVTHGMGWEGKGSETLVNNTLTWGFRGLGSSEDVFRSNTNGNGTMSWADSRKRYFGGGAFIYLRTEVSHTRELPEGLQLFLRAQGQLANDPLISNEQFSGGGQETARGYLESEATGDDAVFGTVEWRSPSLGPWLDKRVSDWRFYVFTDMGTLLVRDVLPEQQDSFSFASVGLGSHLKIQDHYNGAFNLGVPLVDGPNTTAYSPRVSFRLWAEF